MLKVLLVTQSFSYGATGGGLVGRVWVDMLARCMAARGRLDVAALGPRGMELPRSEGVNVLDFRGRSGKVLTLLRLLIGLQALCGLRTHWRLKRLMRRERYDLVVFDVSLFGRLTRFAVRGAGAKTLVYFQNIEKDYFGRQARALPFWYRLVYWNARYNERLAARFATFVSLINFQEEPRLVQLYGRRMDLHVPVCMPRPERRKPHAPDRRLELLFVGAPYYGNIDGLRHFIRYVLPRTGAHLTVAGRGMDRALAGALTPQVTCLGFVPDLADAYASCHRVVAPLYTGAGMKVKIAEAWAYGKKVLATPFAASGYPVTDPDAIELCDTDEAFAGVINRQTADDGVSEAALRLFGELYDTEVVMRRMAEFIDSHV